MTNDTPLREAQFDRAAIKQYLMLQPVLVMLVTVVLIPVIPVVLIFAWFFIDKYLDRLGCTLTHRTLEIRKGVLNRVESTIPLEKITDLQMYQGPIMRYLGIKGFKVETAGQSSGPTGYLVNMIGIIDTADFRHAVLRQRDMKEGASSDRIADHSTSQPSIASTELLVEIRDVLMRIESKLEK